MDFLCILQLITWEILNFLELFKYTLYHSDLNAGSRDALKEFYLIFYDLKKFVLILLSLSCFL